MVDKVLVAGSGLWNSNRRGASHLCGRRFRTDIPLDEVRDAFATTFRASGMSITDAQLPGPSAQRPPAIA